jgi:hypothetical protein
MVPIDPCQILALYFGAAAFCKTKIEDTRTGTIATNYGF